MNEQTRKCKTITFGLAVLHSSPPLLGFLVDAVLMSDTYGTRWWELDIILYISGCFPGPMYLVRVTRNHDAE